MVIPKNEIAMRKRLADELIEQSELVELFRTWLTGSLPLDRREVSCIVDKHRFKTLCAITQKISKNDVAAESIEKTKEVMMKRLEEVVIQLIKKGEKFKSHTKNVGELIENIKKLLRYILKEGEKLQRSGDGRKEILKIKENIEQEALKLQNELKESLIIDEAMGHLEGTIESLNRLLKQTN